MMKKKFSYKRKLLLEKIKVKNPKLSLHEIEIIISNFENLICDNTNSIRLTNITIPLFGNIHTHGNRVNYLNRTNNKKLEKRRAKKNIESAKNLLF